MTIQMPAYIDKPRSKAGLPFFAIGLGLLFITLAGCGRDVDAGRANAEIVHVHVAPIEKESRRLPIRASGRLAAKAEVKLSFKIGGIIEHVFVDEGTGVKQGESLARLNLAEIDAQVLQAQSALDKAGRDLARVERLYRDSVATLEQYQDAKTGVDIAEANVNIAEFNRRYAEINAPASGDVLRRMAESGELVSPGQPVFLFGADQGGWVVRAGLVDRDIVKIAAGDSASLSFDAFPDRTFSGFVTEVADGADPMSGTFEIEVAVNDPGDLLKSGFIARMDLFPSRGPMLDYIPVEALVEGNGREGVVYAYEAATGEARKIPIQIAQILDREIAVSGGLDGYDHVVTDGAVFIKTNGVVEVVDAAE